MKTKSINPENMTLKLTTVLNHGQIYNLYKEQRKTVRDLILVAASLLFFGCTMYYAIASGKKVSAQATEYKVQNYKSKTQSI
jgi:hypothetical protein